MHHPAARLCDVQTRPCAEETTLRRGCSLDAGRNTHRVQGTHACSSTRSPRLIAALCDVSLQLRNISVTGETASRMHARLWPDPHHSTQQINTASCGKTAQQLQHLQTTPPFCLRELVEIPRVVAATGHSMGGTGVRHAPHAVRKARWELMMWCRTTCAWWQVQGLLVRGGGGR